MRVVLAISSLVSCALAVTWHAAHAEARDEPAVEGAAPAALTPEDKAALAGVAAELPLHGLALVTVPPPDEASDEPWLKLAKKLVAAFAPESLKPSARKALVEARPLGDAVRALVPRHRRYRALQELLVVYAHKHGQPLSELPEAGFEKNRIRVGVTASEVGVLRDRLRAEGYGDEGVQGRLRDYFDDRLKRALQAWQKDHELPPTVVVDTLTRKRLNAPIALPVAEVALALARFRALDLRRDEGRQLIVHLNDYRLIAERDGAPELAMPVVVGKASALDQTPHVSTRLETVIANPSWGVPQRIVDDLRAGAQGIPEMLIDKGYEVTVDEGGRWRVRMPPGPDNPLGRLKFQLADTKGVYLHDTNARSVFARDARSLSHGCVRLSDPVGLARWVLAGKDAEIDDALGYASYTTTFDGGSLPTHLVYQTALVEDGRLVRFPDIYDRDAAALAELDAAAIAEGVRLAGK